MDSHARRMRAAASAYTRLGIHVFPLVPGTKFPYRGTHGELDAINDTELAERWWTMLPGSNIGWALRYSPGVFVLDVDERSGGSEWLTERERLPDTVRVQTPSMGLGGHHWLALTPALSYVSSTGLRDHWPVGECALIDSVDVKGLHRGYVVLPPSEIKGKGSYRFEVDCSPLEQEIATCPQWLESEILRDAESHQPTPSHQFDVDPGSFYFGRLFLELGLLGPQIRHGVWHAHCPNREQHTGKPRSLAGDVIVFAPPPGRRGQGWFYCAHAHCKNLMAVLKP